MASILSSGGKHQRVERGGLRPLLPEADRQDRARQVGGPPASGRGPNPPELAPVLRQPPVVQQARKLR